jgi:hypothetical protein
MTVYIVVRIDCEDSYICGVFSSYELANNYIKNILSNDKNKFLDFYISESVIDQPDQ